MKELIEWVRFNYAPVHPVTGLKPSNAVLGHLFAIYGLFNAILDRLCLSVDYWLYGKKIDWDKVPIYLAEQYLYGECSLRHIYKLGYTK